MKNLFRVQSSKFKVQSSRFEPRTQNPEPGSQNPEVRTRNPEPGTRNPEQGAAAWALSAVLALMPAIAAAQAMSDPTRPPGAFATGEPEAGGDVAGGPVLQSVLISPTVKAAIISGETVKLGDKYGDAVLVKVAEAEVVLKSGDTTQVLKMYPGVEKRESAPAASKRAPRRGTTPRRGAESPAAEGEPAR